VQRVDPGSGPQVVFINTICRGWRCGKREEGDRGYVGGKGLARPGDGVHSTGKTDTLHCKLKPHPQASCDELALVLHRANSSGGVQYTCMPSRVYTASPAGTQEAQRAVFASQRELRSRRACSWQ